MKQYFQAEYDEMLIEYCGEVLTVLAAKLKEEFLPYFLAFLPAFLKKLVSSVDLLEKQVMLQIRFIEKYLCIMFSFSAIFVVMFKVAKCPFVSISFSIYDG